MGGLVQGRAGPHAAHARHRPPVRRRRLLRRAPEHLRRHAVPEEPARPVRGRRDARPRRLQRRAGGGPALRRRPALPGDAGLRAEGAGPARRGLRSRPSGRRRRLLRPLGGAPRPGARRAPPPARRPGPPPGAGPAPDLLPVARRARGDPRGRGARPPKARSTRPCGRSTEHVRRPDPPRPVRPGALPRPLQQGPGALRGPPVRGGRAPARGGLPPAAARPAGPEPARARLLPRGEAREGRGGLPQADRREPRRPHPPLQPRHHLLQAGAGSKTRSRSS